MYVILCSKPKKYTKFKSVFREHCLCFLTKCSVLIEPTPKRSPNYDFYTGFITSGVANSQNTFQKRTGLGGGESYSENSGQTSENLPSLNVVTDSEALGHVKYGPPKPKPFSPPGPPPDRDSSVQETTEAVVTSKNSHYPTTSGHIELSETPAKSSRALTFETLTNKELSSFETQRMEENLESHSDSSANRRQGFEPFANPAPFIPGKPDLVDDIRYRGGCKKFKSLNMTTPSHFPQTLIRGPSFPQEPLPLHQQRWGEEGTGFTKRPGHSIPRCLPTPTTSTTHISSSTWKGPTSSRRVTPGETTTTTSKTFRKGSDTGISKW